MSPDDPAERTCSATGLRPDDAHLVSSENVGIAELFEVASRLGIPVLPGRRRI